MQILVLGAHRSGTSMVTRLINMMGAYFGLGESSIGANSENPKGFWERADVIAANDDILRHYGCEWDKLSTWKFSDTISKKDREALAPTYEAMKNIILDLDASRPWVMKDPRLCITYPFWKELLEVPVIVCVYRNPQEVSRSLKTRNQFSFSHSMALWEYYATGISNAIRNTPTVYVSHKELLSDPVGVVQKLMDDLQTHGVRGLSMPSEREITSFIDPGLYRSHGDENALSDMVTNYQKRLIDYVSGTTEAPSELQRPTELASDLAEALAAFRSLQDKQEDLNERYADALQQNNEMKSRLESIHRETSALHDRYAALVDNEKRQLEFLRESESWRIGNSIVRFVRRITFQGSRA